MRVILTSETLVHRRPSACLARLITDVAIAACGIRVREEPSCADTRIRRRSGELGVIMAFFTLVWIRPYALRAGFVAVVAF